MIRAKNYETASKFVKIMQRKLVASFFPDTVHVVLPGVVRVHIWSRLSSNQCWIFTRHRRFHELVHSVIHLQHLTDFCCTRQSKNKNVNDCETADITAINWKH